MNEEELKKGCGKDLKRKAFKNPSLSLYCGIEVFVSESVGLKVILCPTCQARLEGFQKGKLEQKKEELRFLLELLSVPFENMRKKKECQDELCPNRYETQRLLNIKIKQLQKEINSQTEQNSDKEVAQPYSKSDTTTKGFILSDEQFQKEVDFAKKEIGDGVYKE